MADVQALTQKIHEYTDWVVEQEQINNPKFKYHKHLDASYRTWTAGDTWTMTEVPKNKVMDYQEVLNFGLFHPEYGQEFANRFETVIPWQLSAEQEYELGEKIAFIDESIQIIKDVIKQDFPKAKPGSFEYDTKLAIALWFFCLIDSNPSFEIVASLKSMTNNYLEICFGDDYHEVGYLDSVSHALNTYNDSEMQDYYQLYDEMDKADCERDFGKNSKHCKDPDKPRKRIMRQSEQLGGLGLLEVEEDLPGEGTVYDVLKRGQGFCTEMAYTYAYIAKRAGLDVGFGQAAIDSPGQPNHRFNIVYCGPKKQPVKIDLAQKSIEQQYTEETPEDPYQVLANFYEQFSQSFEKYPQIFEHNFFLGYALDPTNPDILNGMASYFYNIKDDIEKTHEYYQASTLYGNAWAFNQSNAANFYDAYPEYDNPKEYYQKAYDIYHTYEEQTGNTSKLDINDLVCYASSAYHFGNLDKAKTLFEQAIAINQYETMLESGSSDYAYCLARSGDIKNGHAWFQSCLVPDNESLNVLILNYLDFVDNFLPIEKRAGAREYAYRVLTEAYEATGIERYQEIAIKLDKTLRYTQPDEEPVISNENLASEPIVDYNTRLSNLIALHKQDAKQELITMYEEVQYFGSFQGSANQMYAQALYNLHVDHLTPENYQQALPDLEKAFFTYPMMDLLIAALAYCYVLDGDEAKIDQLFDKIHGLVSQPDILYAKLASAYFDAKEFGSAAYYYKQAIKHEPDSGFYHYNYAASLYNNEQDSEAEAYYDKACTLDPQYCKQ